MKMKISELLEQAGEVVEKKGKQGCVGFIEDDCEFNEGADLILSKEIDLEKLGLVKKTILPVKEIKLDRTKLRNIVVKYTYEKVDELTDALQRYTEKLLKAERLDTWKTAHEQYKFDDVMNKELFIPKSDLREILKRIARIMYMDGGDKAKLETIKNVLLSELKENKPSSN